MSDIQECPDESWFEAYLRGGIAADTGSSKYIWRESVENTGVYQCPVCNQNHVIGVGCSKG